MFDIRRLLVFVLVVFLVSPAFAINDPTRPSNYRTTATKKIQFVLESILIGKQRKVAVINGKPLTEGEQIGGAKVVRIDKASVRIINDGKIVDLKPRRTSIRQEK